MITERELEILDLMSKGKTNKEIAEATFTSYETVKQYNVVIYQKLHARNRANAVWIYLSNIRPKILTKVNCIQ